MAIYKSIPLILLVGKQQFVIFPISLRLYIIFYRARFMYCLIDDNKVIKKIDHI